MKAIAANDRTIAAIRKADALPTVITGGRFKKGNVPSASAGTSYNGPFTVAKTADTEVEVLGYSVADSQYFNDYIILGLSRIEVTDATPVTGITASGYIYLSITYSGSYSVSVLHASSLPAQDNTHIYHPIAYVVCASSVISSITQIQYGTIHYPARAG